MVALIKLLKTWAYALIALCTFTGLGDSSDFCARGDCGGYKAATIVFSLISSLLALGMLVLWLITEAVASRLCPIVSNVLFGLLIIAAGVSSQTSKRASIGFLALYISLLVALLLAVYSWNSFTSNFKIVKSDNEGERSVSISQPPATAETEV